MKKIITKATAFDKRFLRKVLIMIKIYIVILICSIYTVKASDSYAQNVRINLELNNVSLSKVIKAIKEQTEFEFAYDANLDQLILNKVSINVNNEKINNVLVNVLKGTSINFKVIDRIILLSKNPLKATSGIENGMILQQQKKITGRVTDATTGESLPGVSIMVQGTTSGAVTGSDGKFTLNVSNANAVLVFSFIGYLTEKIEVSGKSDIDIKLKADVRKLDEVVVVGYGTQKKVNLTGSVATIQSKDLTVASVASTANTLAGRMPGLISLQSSGQPGADAASLSIRGFGNALVIVDGIETGFNSIDANQIESISILKDGSAAIYGSRAGNGVILVTTKRGIDSKPIITFNTSQTLQGITIMPKPVNAGQYAEMKSETWLQSGKPADQVPYTTDQIKKYYDGTDPLYPNTDWYNEIVKDWAPQQNHNLSIRGGSDKIKYYGFLGYLDQGSMWKKNGGDYKRYNFQSNIDAKILDNLTLQLTIASTIENRDFPARPQATGTGGVWTDLWFSSPLYPATLPDPFKF